jgi:SAM-dependent methyltransferase
VVHEVAREGFRDPTDYEAARPSYPPEAVAWIVARLGIAPGRRVVDLAAGTGKLTRLLAPTGADLVAVEPVAGMRALFRTIVPGVPLVAGTAEEMPFATASLDAVTVAQAWHWFDEARAARELLRVLRPGGGAVLVWNGRDRSEPWVDAVWSVVDRVEKRAPWRDHDRHAETDRGVPGFAHAEVAAFRNEQRLTPDGVVRRVASISHVATLPPGRRAAVLAEVRALLGDAELLTLPYRVDCIAVTRP